jgi:hypothetical protein
LFARLNIYVYRPLAVLALSVAVLAISPAVAQAQGIAATNDAHGTERIVVRPGDSLWSISEERLGPNATPRQIDRAVERIYALNRDRIGADPNRIFPGQEFLVPPAWLSTLADRTDEPIVSESPSRELIREPARKVVRRTASETVAERARAPMAEPVALPAVPKRQAVPKLSWLAVNDVRPTPTESLAGTTRSVVSSAASAIVEAFPENDVFKRRLLGLGIIALTLLIGGLLAWKLPMRRSVGDWEVRKIPSGYLRHYAYSQTHDLRGSTLATASVLTGSGSNYHISKGKDIAEEQGVSSVGLARVARMRQRLILRGQPHGSGLLLRRGLASATYDPDVRRPLLRIATRTRPWLSENVRTQASQRRGGNP